MFGRCFKWSIFRHLVQQVQEQSPLCDFTVKVGLWTKRFHRCVLVTSPFFERAIKADFREKHEGMVQVTVGTSNSVEMAIMYLYGVVPDINIGNVEMLLEQAEYFMIAGLKTTCISWLCSSEVTKDTYKCVLKLSSLYNFDVPNCMAYIKSHLPEVFQTEEALYFSMELINNLLTDEKLCYVKMNERFSFLMQWTKRNTGETKSNIMKLFETIDIRDISDSLLREASSFGFLNEIIVMSDVKRRPNENECKRNVLIMTNKLASLVCLDLQQDKWFKLVPENKANILRRNISGIRNMQPEIYFTEGLDHFTFKPMFTTLNVETNEINSYKFSLKDGDISREIVTNICLEDNTLIVLTRKCVNCIETYAFIPAKDACFPGPSTSDTCLPLSKTRIRLICEDEKTVEFVCDNRKATVNETINTVVHIGNVTAGNVEIEPIFCLRNISSSQACLNNSISTVAFLSDENSCVVLFDLLNYKLETFRLEPYTHYTLSSTNKGFVIYNNKRCYCLSKTHCSLPIDKYLIEFESNDQTFRYLNSNGFWFRFYDKGFLYDRNVEMSFISHEELLNSGCPKDLKWKQLSIPNRDLLNQHSSNKGLFVIQLSTSRLRCHIHCPHCKYSEEQNHSMALRKSNGGYYL